MAKISNAEVIEELIAMMDDADIKVFCNAYHKLEDRGIDLKNLHSRWVIAHVMMDANRFMSEGDIKKYFRQLMKKYISGSAMRGDEEEMYDKLLAHILKEEKELQ